MRKTAFIYSDDVLEYDFGKQHPLRPERVKMTIDLLKAYGVVAPANFIKPRYADWDELKTCHSEQFLNVVDRLSNGEPVPTMWEFGFGAGDNPPFMGMWEASLLYSGASIQAAEAVLDDPETIGINFAGGLHHAHRNRASGFCIFNDCALAVKTLQKKYKRVAYIDLDVHHGDGVQWLFYSDPNVMTISIHESGKWLFPGTGDTDEIGKDEGEGYSVNLPFAPGTPNDVWYDSIEKYIFPVLAAFKPEAIVLQMGADPHYLDALGHLQLTVQGWSKAVKRIVDMGIPLVALGGGGYTVSSVCRMWTMAYSILADIELPDQIPHEFGQKNHLTTLTDHVQIATSDDEREIVDIFTKQRCAEIEKLLFPKYNLAL